MFGLNTLSLSIGWLVMNIALFVCLLFLSFFIHKFPCLLQSVHKVNKGKYCNELCDTHSFFFYKPCQQCWSLELGLQFSVLLLLQPPPQPTYFFFFFSAIYLFWPSKSALSQSSYVPGALWFIVFFFSW